MLNVRSFYTTMKTNLTLNANGFLSFCFVLICAACVYVSNGFAQKTSGYYAHLKPEHQATLKTYLGSQTNLRPAQISDCKNKFGLDSLRQSAGKSAHPYYAIADFNQDRVSDFAIVLYDSKKAANARFTVLIFNGAKSGDYKMAYKSEAMDLRQGGIWTYGFSTDGKKKTVTAGEYETDNCIWIEWERGRYVVHDCAEMEN